MQQCAYADTILQLMSHLGIPNDINPRTTKTGQHLLKETIELIKTNCRNSSSPLSTADFSDLTSNPPFMNVYYYTAIEDLQRWWKESQQVQIPATTGSEKNKKNGDAKQQVIEYMINDLQVIKITPTFNTPSSLYPRGQNVLFLHKQSQQYSQFIYDEDNVRRTPEEYLKHVCTREDFPEVPPSELPSGKELLLLLENNAEQILAENFNPEHLVHFRNGIYDLTDLSFTPEDAPEYSEYSRFAFSACVPFDYTARTNKHNLIYDVLNKMSLKDPKFLIPLKTYLGYCLTSSIKHQIAMIVVGKTASNGKSTLGNIIQQMFTPPTFANVPIEHVASRFGGPTLENKLINITDDQSRGYSHNTGVLKRLITEKLLYVEQKQKKPYSIINTCKQLIFANDVMQGPEMDTPEMLRRLIYLNVQAQFKDIPQDDPANATFKLDASLSSHKYTEQELTEFVNDCFRHYINYKDKLNSFSDSDLIEQSLMTNNRTYEWLQKTNLSNYSTWSEAFAANKVWRQYNGYSQQSEERFKQACLSLNADLYDAWIDTSGLTQTEISDIIKKKPHKDDTAVTNLAQQFTLSRTKRKNEAAKLAARTAYLQQISAQTQLELQSILCDLEVETKTLQPTDPYLQTKQFKANVLQFSFDMQQTCEKNFKRFKEQFDTTLPACARTLTLWKLCVQKICKLPITKQSSQTFFGAKFNRKGDPIDHGTLYTGMIEHSYDLF